MTVINNTIHSTTFDVLILAKVGSLDFSTCTGPDASNLARHIKREDRVLDVSVFGMAELGTSDRVVVRIRLRGSPDQERPVNLVRGAIAAMQGRAG